MGEYDPWAPYVQGLSWVPIRDESLQADTSVEDGYRFTLTSPTNVNMAKVYVSDLSASPNPTPPTVTIYRSGMEDAVGPVESVLIPVEGGTLGGDAYATTGSVFSSLRYPSDMEYVSLTSFGGIATVSVEYNTSAYSSVMAGKRILGIDIIFQMSADFAKAVASYDMPIVTSAGFDAFNLFHAVDNGPASLRDAIDFQKVSVGDLYWFYYPDRFVTRWTNQSLQRFDSSSSNPLWVQFIGPLTQETGTVYLGYTALKVYLCEENRVLIGAATTFDAVNYNLKSGANEVVLRDSNAATGTVLPAGDYTITVGADSREDGGTYLSALRELYTNPSHEGVSVARWLRESSTPPALSTTHVIPQITLWSSGGALITPVHAYGDQVQAGVWGGTSGLVAKQAITPRGLTGATDFPMARFYARRYGTASSTLTLAEDSTGSPSASITSEVFDALPEILDGWRQVDLTFEAPTPSFDAATVTYRWSSDAADVNHQWQVLGALASTGPTAGTNFGTALGPATYGGSTAYATWSAPSVSGTAELADVATDLVLMFSQSPPAVTGLSVSIESQAVTGIGRHCDVDPDWIPTDIHYHRVTWSATASSMPATGFGYYELQRRDTLDDWVTIAHMTSASATGFNDFEARVGLDSDYRIRALGALAFGGQWSATTSSTLTAPGVAGNAIDDTSQVLIFTSNQSQSGAYNLAYAYAFDGDATEAFSFPEAGDLTLQKMYGKDYFTAFHPSERGGVRFSRPILVQAAAISPEALEDFRGLRDMAWADVPAVCVRDELGDRWFAAVSVPDGSVVNRRTIYLASVDIVEVSDIPSVVVV